MMNLYIFLFFCLLHSAATLTSKEIEKKENSIVSITSDDSLIKAVKVASARFKKHKSTGHLLYKKYGISAQDRERTLHFIADVMHEDQRAGRSTSRLQNTAFLEKHFKWISWKPNIEQADAGRASFPPSVKEELDKKILLTKYAAFKIPGSMYKTDHFSCALYEDRDYQKHVRLTKQEIIAGKLDQYIQHYKPLVWVTKKGLEHALMHGTVIVTMPNKKERILYAHTHNRYAYESKKPVHQQKRYWFFREIKNIATMAQHHLVHMLETKNACFAGDIHNLGMGSLLALNIKNPLNNKHQRALGFLIDTGGAFKNNQYQLDIFLGLCPEESLFNQQIKSFAENAEAYFLVKK